MSLIILSGTNEYTEYDTEAHGGHGDCEVDYLTDRKRRG